MNLENRICLYAAHADDIITMPICTSRKGEPMDEYHVGCGLFGIYAGTLKPRNKNEWRNKSNVTQEALNAVAQYLLVNEKELRFDYCGTSYVMKVERRTDETD